MLLNDDFFKNNADVIILITWLMLKCLLKSKYVLYEVSSDLGKITTFIVVSLTRYKKPPVSFKSSKKPACYSVKVGCIWSPTYISNVLYSRNQIEIAVSNIHGYKVTFHKILSSVKVIHSEQEKNPTKKSKGRHLVLTITLRITKVKLRSTEVTSFLRITLIANNQIFFFFL